MMIFRLVILFLWVMCGSAFAGQISDVPVNSWQRIPSSHLYDVRHTWSPTTPGTFSGIMTAWSGGFYDSTRHRLCVKGGGHADYGGQEMYCFNLDTAEAGTTPAWSKVSEPEAYSALDSTGLNADGLTDNDLPKSQHTYGRPGYIPSIDSVCDTNGSIGYAYVESLDFMTCYSFTTNTWTIKADADPDSSGTASFGVVHPATNKYYVQGGSGSGYFGIYTPSTDTWQYGAFDNNFSSSNIYMSATIDTKRNQFVAVGKGNLIVFTLADFVAGSTKLWDYRVTNSTGETGALTGNYGAPGVAYDPVLDKIVVWTTGYDGVYLYDTDTNVWTKPTLTPPDDTTGLTAQTNATYGRFQYSPKYNAFVVVNDVNKDVYALRLSAAETNIGAATLTGTTTGTAPFTFGVPLQRGDIPSGSELTTDLTNYQVVEKRYWNDGSLKHAIISGSASMTSGSPLTVQLYSGGTQPTGTNLTTTDLSTAISSTTASVQLGEIGTVNLNDLKASPVRTWLQGPQMIEAHYGSDVSGNADLHVKFHVRLYADGGLWVRCIVENGILDGAVGDTQSYVPTVTIGGSTAWNNGGSSLSHYGNTRWDIDGWVGITDPEIKIAYSKAYIEDTKLVPHYWKTGASATKLNSLNQAYTPMEQGDWTASMGAAGFQNQIGLIPNWEALYITTGGDYRAYNSVISDARAINSYPIIRRDPTTDAPIVVSSWPTWTYNGAGGTGTDQVVAGALTWEYNHHPSAGYLAYIVTGDYYFLETMQYQSTLCFLCVTSSQGSGESRKLLRQVRGTAWAYRTIGQLSGIAPSDSISDSLSDLLAYQATYWKSVIDQAGMNQMGYIYEYSANPPNFAYGDGITVPWMHHFWIQTNGHVSDLEPLSDMTTWDAVRDHMYKGIVGILGPNGADSWCFTKAGNYNVDISAVDNINTPAEWYDSWGDIYTATFGSANTSCANTLEGTSGSTPSDAATGYWGNLLPAIAYAVEDSAPGALDAWTRLIGATNWNDVETSGFEDIPIWGITPRSSGAAPGPYKNHGAPKSFFMRPTL